MRQIENQRNGQIDNAENNEEMPTDQDEETDQEIQVDVEEVSDDEDSHQSPEGDEFVPNTNALSDEEEEQLVSDEVMKAIKGLAEAMSLNKLFERKHFSNLTRKSQLLKVRHVKEMHDAIYKAVCPSAPSMLKEMVDSTIIRPTTNSDLLINELMTKIADDYADASNLHIRNAILSVVSSTIPFSIFTKYVPQISYSTYRRSQYFPTIEAQIEKEGVIRHKEKFNAEAVASFVQFLSAPEFIVDLPYGSQILTLSNKQKIDVPHIVRRHTHAELITLYKSFLVESGQTSFAMSTSSYVRVLNALPAKSSKALQCVDYFISDGESGLIFYRVLENNLKLYFR